MMIRATILANDMAYISCVVTVEKPYYLVRVPKPGSQRKFFTASRSISVHGKAGAKADAQKARDALVQKHYPQKTTKPECNVITTLNQIDGVVVDRLYDLHQMQRKARAIRLPTLALMSVFRDREYTARDVYELLDTDHKKLGGKLSALKKSKLIICSGHIVQTQGAMKAQLLTLSGEAKDILDLIRCCTGTTATRGPKHYAELYRALLVWYPDNYIVTLNLLLMVEAGATYSGLIAEWTKQRTLVSYIALESAKKYGFIEPTDTRVLRGNGPASQTFQLTARGRKMLDYFRTL